jgi:hypothetical protein
MIIGLSGYAQSGKDTVAEILVEEYGYTRVAFADIIKQAVYLLDPIVNVSGMRLRYFVDQNGWNEAKHLPEVRRLLQVMGSEVGRDLIDPQIWVELTMYSVSPMDNIVISDVRFKNEAAEIKFKAGQIWRITRIDRNKPINLHRSETELDTWNFDQYVANNGTIDELRTEIRGLMWRQ